MNLEYICIWYQSQRVVTAKWSCLLTLEFPSSSLPCETDVLSNHVAPIVCFVSSLTRWIMNIAWIYISFINQTHFYPHWEMCWKHLLQHIPPHKHSNIFGFQVSKCLLVFLYYVCFCLLRLLMLHCLQGTLWLFKFDVSFIIIVWLQIKISGERDNTLFGNNDTSAIAYVKWKLIMAKLISSYKAFQEFFIVEWWHFFEGSNKFRSYTLMDFKQVA